MASLTYLFPPLALALAVPVAPASAAVKRLQDPQTAPGWSTPCWTTWSKSVQRVADGQGEKEEPRPHSTQDYFPR